MNSYTWYLEGHGVQMAQWQVPLRSFPFRIGRLEQSDLTLSFNGISRRHAEIIELDGELWIDECGSTNGTFVNQERVQERTRLSAGDLIHFGAVAFRLLQKADSPSNESTQAITAVSNSPLALDASMQAPGSIDLAANAAKMTALLHRRTVNINFQAIFQLQHHRPAGYELLGRGNAPDLPQSPAKLFEIAAALGTTVELSELFRDQGVRYALELGMTETLFVNTAPQEIGTPQLAHSLTALRKQHAEFPLVLEIHEKALTSTDTMRELHALLKDLGIALAYDDFGAGQARLLELMDAPPDWLKFDISLIRNIHLQPPRALQIVRTLVQMAHDLNIKTIAEGIELEAEKNCCQDIGFQYGQGYLLSRPSATLWQRD